MEKKAKALVWNQGIVALPNPTVGKVIPKKTEKALHEYYLSENISREIPGMKDFVSVFRDGKSYMYRNI